MKLSAYLVVGLPHEFLTHEMPCKFLTHGEYLHWTRPGNLLSILATHHRIATPHPAKGRIRFPLWPWHRRCESEATLRVCPPSIQSPLLSLKLIMVWYGFSPVLRPLAPLAVAFVAPLPELTSRWPPLTHMAAAPSPLSLWRTKRPQSCHLTL